MKNNSKVVIIGGGILGLTIARQLLKDYHGISVSILEKESSLGVHASGRNSGVLHTGIYYPSNTMKAKFCKNGADAMFEYAQNNGVSVKKSGKVIIATSQEEIPQLDKLMENSKNSGIAAERIVGQGISDIEPLANNEYEGIYCKDTAVIDSKGLLKKLEEEVIALGAKIIFSQKVVSVSLKERYLYSENDRYNFDFVINASGSHADAIAKLFGIGNEFILIPFKGIYYKLKDHFASNLKGSIYPVPNPNLPFLGIHFTKNIFGDTYIGPTAIPALGRENYSLLKGLNLIESSSVLFYLSKLFINNNQNFRSLVLTEFPHLFKYGFFDSAKKLITKLNPTLIEKSPKVGIRPQLFNKKSNTLEMDFLFKIDDISLHLLNSISPAWTSSFAVAEHISIELNDYLK